jgi:hypothetical protein
MSQPLSEAFARAVAAKDDDRLRDLLHPEIDFNGMTPGRIWPGSSPEDVLETVHQWFEDSDHIEEIVALETDAFADRERVGYRFRLRNPDGEHLVEQQAYLSERDGRIGWLRIMCSGFRLID